MPTDVEEGQRAEVARVAVIRVESEVASGVE